MIKHCIPVIVLLGFPTLSVFGQTESAPPAPMYVTVRLRPDIKRETLVYLSEIVKPQKIEVTAGSDFRSVLRMTYGFSSPKMRSFVAYASPGIVELLPATNDITLDVPPSFKGGTKLTVTPKQPVTLKQLAWDLMGTAGNRTRHQIERLNAALVGRWDSLVRGRVRIPYFTTLVSYELKEGIDVDAQTIIKRLRADHGVQRVEITQGYRLAPTYATASLSDSTPSSQGTGGSWPPGWLPRDLSLQSKPRLHVATIGVADTGLAGDDPRFPLWLNRDPSLNLDTFTSECSRFLYGCNFLKPAEPPADDSIDSHGTHVAGLTVASLYPAKAEVSKRAEIMVLKVGDSRGVVKPADLVNAIRYATMRNAAIINLSLTGPDYNGLKSIIEANRNVLFVAAAGNAESGPGIDFDDSRLAGDRSTGYPARWAAQHENVISVAAACPNGDLCGFSNRGANSISVAAPGYELDSTAPNSRTKTLSGSSQATALVTLSAALLYAEGGMTALTIKNRIVASTDFVPDLRNKVFSAGVLNISKALRMDVDLIRYRFGGSVVQAVGEIKGPTSLSVRDQANDIGLCKVFRIVPNYSDNPRERVQITIRDEDGKLRHIYGETIRSVSFLTENGELKLIPAIDVLDIVPKVRECN